MRQLLQLATLLLALPLAASAACISWEQAAEHIGDTTCVTGKVLNVSQGSSGVTFLNFCADYRTCPFTVVVFPRDLRCVGDVRQLAGRTIEIHSNIRAYDGRPEIILRRANQLKGVKLAALPKEYDVERRGRYRAGKFGHAKSSAKTRQPRSAPGISTEEPEPPPAQPE